MAFVAQPKREPINVPFGWTALGDSSYVITTDFGLRTGSSGFTTATIRSDLASVEGSGVLQQSIRAINYRGKRVRLTGYLKANANDADANLWFRVDGASEVLASDYMENRPIRGTTGWTQYSIVLDVPRNATGLTFGFALAGPGQVWMDDLSLEIVDPSLPTTGHAFGIRGWRQKLGRSGWTTYENLPRAPINLDFEQKLIASR